MESSVGVQSGGLKLEHGCDKESTIVVQHKVNNVILTPKEKRASPDKKYRLRRGNVEEDVEKERQRKRIFHNADNNAANIKRHLKQLYENSPKPRRWKKYYYEENKEKQREKN